MSRVALAFAYDGTAFDSFARQPGKTTVEGELIRLLRSHGVLRDPRAARWGVASRTDAGVSAEVNVCAFDSSMDPRTLAHLRPLRPGLWLRAAASAPSDFDPRRDATRRAYRYSVDPDGLDVARMRQAADLFVGSHDFKNFCRPDRGVPTRRLLTTLDVQAHADRLDLAFAAPNFLWEQVRRISQALVDVGAGRVGMEAVAARLSAVRKDPQPAAPPEPLVLCEVETRVRFPPPSKALLRRLRSEADLQRARAAFYAGLAASAPTARR